jgi:hypothetical protein
MITAEQLAAALPHVLAAPKDATVIDHLTYRADFNQRAHPDSLTLTRAEGIPGERWLKHPWLTLPDGSPDPNIQISILPLRVLTLVWQDHSKAHPGDTIVADLDTSTTNLPEGTILQAGTARLRVSSVFNDGCVKWKARYGAAAKDWITAPGHPELRLRGILCAVVQDGTVRKGDPLTVLSR